jgi:hypothetical protein
MLRSRSGVKFASELLGTMLLLAAVVGSGIMGEALAQGNLAVALLANAAATAGVLYVLITILGPLSGATSILRFRWSPSRGVSSRALTPRRISLRNSRARFSACCLHILCSTSTSCRSLPRRARASDSM